MPDPAICEQTLAALKPIVLPEYRGAGMPFGPETDVPAGASALVPLPGGLLVAIRPASPRSWLRQPRRPVCGSPPSWPSRTVPR